jgi:hypothetical protein
MTSLTMSVDSLLHTYTLGEMFRLMSARLATMTTIPRTNGASLDIPRFFGGPFITK